LPRPLPPPTWRDRADEAWRWWTGLSARLRWAAVSVAGFVVVVVLVVAVLAPRVAGGALGGGSGVADSALPRAGTASDPSGFRSGGSSTTVAGDGGGSGVVVVYVAGAVVHPGVYRLTGDVRVTDAIDAAGGVTGGADLSVMNLAAKVGDGQRVYVPRVGETPPAEVGPTGGGSAQLGGAGGASTDAIVNLNTATEAELESLPGVGPSTAQSIISYRTQHGPFHRVDDLLNVRGIGPSKLDQIRPRARV
jgi:competence protein ComEA